METEYNYLINNGSILSIHKSSLTNYANCFWYNFITVLTIGYGDMVS